MENTTELMENSFNRATAIVPRSKTALVRNILIEIGAISEKEPPEGWVQEVEKRLSENDLKMNRNTIYFTRRKMLKANGKNNIYEKRARSKKKFSAKTNPVVKNENLVFSTDNNKSAVSQTHMNALKDIQKFAARFGGLRQLGDIVNFLISIKENRS